eukprot:6457149-Amphidinium_carterae.1
MFWRPWDWEGVVPESRTQHKTQTNETVNIASEKRSLHTNTVQSRVYTAVSYTHLRAHETEADL